MKVPYGYCQCGCGGKAPLSPVNVRTRGLVKGEPQRYIRNHASKDPAVKRIISEANKGRGLDFSEADLLEMERLYRMGYSTAEIGVQFGCLGGSVHRRLVDRGIEMRPPAATRKRARLASHGYVRWGKSYIHRIVAEAWYGREIGPDEHVHHIDGDKTNNHPENLRIMAAGDHHRLHMTQQRARRMSRKAVIARYGAGSLRTED